MTLNEAVDLLGINRTKDGDIRQMVRALSLVEFMNTDEENRQLAAGRYVLRRWPQYQAECNLRRDLRQHKRG